MNAPETRQPVDACADLAKFRDYSRERCAEISAEGGDWDCPADSLDARVSPEALETSREAVGNVLDQRDSQRR